MEKYYTIPEISKKTGVNYQVFYRLIKKGMPHIKKIINTSYTRNNAYGKNWGKRQKRKIAVKRELILINYEDWLAIPTFIRNKYKKRYAG